MSKKLRKLPSRIIWIPRGWSPISIGVCLTKKAWSAYTKKNNTPHEWDGGQASVTRFGSDALIIAFDESTRGLEYKLGTIGLVAHEVQHVWQFVKEAMQEEAPGAEVEAYAVQAMFQQVIDVLEHYDFGLVKGYEK